MNRRPLPEAAKPANVAPHAASVAPAEAMARNEASQVQRRAPEPKAARPREQPPASGGWTWCPTGVRPAPKFNSI